MAQFFTPFDEYQEGQFPAGWFLRWRESNIVIKKKDGVYVLEHSAEGDEVYAVSWDKASAGLGYLATVEMLGQVRATAAGVRSALIVRGGGFDQGYMYVPPVDAFAEGEKINIRLRVEGNKIYGKYWHYKDDEPEEWMSEIEDNEYPEGWIGICAYASAGIRDWLFIGVGTDGDPAPDGPVIPKITPEEPERTTPAPRLRSGFHFKARAERYSDEEFLTDEDALIAVNEAISKLGDLALIYDKTYVAAEKAGWYNLPVDCIHVVSVDSAYGVDYPHYRVRGGLIEFKNTGQYRVNYRRMPKHLASLNDIPETHPAYDDCLVTYMRYWLKMQDDEDSVDADRLYQKFQADVSATYHMLSRGKKGPLTVKVVR